MAELIVSIDISAPVDLVWSHLADLASHGEWMSDVESIELLTGHEVGVGTRMRVATKVGPFRTNDIMDVVSWEEYEAIGVRHVGIVTGEGRFSIYPTKDGTSFIWAEILTFPWYLGGALTALASKPILRWIWRRNLENLRRRIETSTGHR